MRSGALAVALAAGVYGATALGDGVTMTANRTLGPDGGAITLAGATLTVPRGAIASPPALALIETADAAPTGFTAYSPVYRIAPAGVAIAQPVSITVRFRGDHTRAALFWLHPGVGYERIAGTIVGDRITAPIAQLTTVFVGAENAATPAAGATTTPAPHGNTPPPAATPAVDASASSTAPAPSASPVVAASSNPASAVAVSPTPVVPVSPVVPVAPAIVPVTPGGTPPSTLTLQGLSGSHEGYRSVQLYAWTGCGLTNAGAPYCWGDNSFGQFGVGSSDTGAHASPTRVAGQIVFTSIAVGGVHVCGITGDGATYCWGGNDNGQTGGADASCGGMPCQTHPLAVFPGRRFTSLSAGRTHTCGLTSAGVAYCWGSNAHGALGYGPTVGPGSPVSGGPYQAISASQDFTCALTSTGHPFCWGGMNAHGELGIGTPPSPGPFTVPMAVASDRAFTQVTTGGFNACGLAADGGAWCWGSNDSGQLGDGSTTQRNTPVQVQVPTGVQFREVHQGTFSACGVTTTNAVYCWGSNRQGALGQGTIDSVDIPHPVPMLVPGLPPVQSLSVENFSACALTTTGERFCWGENDYSGELGDGTLNNRASPERIP